MNSYIPINLRDIFRRRDVEKGILFCDELFDMFSKELDSVPVIILKHLRNEQTDLISLIIIDYLISYLQLKYFRLQQFNAFN